MKIQFCSVSSPFELFFSIFTTTTYSYGVEIKSQAS